tara:strand:+ start:86 stop:514 length:429 start_codon:yes stop_codon:yes gene_type:complete
MIINCDKCNKKFNLDDSLIPDKGRLLQCGSCQNVWFYKINHETSISEIRPNISNENLEVNEDEDSISEDKISNISKSSKKRDLSNNLLSNLIVTLITFVALIILADTFKYNLSNLIPGIIPLLDNFYATLYDLLLFIKDLLN